MTDNQKNIVLWCVPRSASTAFERAFRGNPDVDTKHEPFSHAYYFGPERVSGRYQDQEPDSTHSYQNVLNSVRKAGAQEKRLFVKDMAYHLAGAQADTITEDVQNTFLIRHPAAALMSLYKVWPDFTLEETGYPALRELFDKVRNETGETPLLYEAQDVCAAPEKYIAHYCQHVAVPFNKQALSWEVGSVNGQEAWQDFHKNVHSSTKINPLQEPPAIETLPPYVRKMVEKVMPDFEALRAHKIQLT